MGNEIIFENILREFSEKLPKFSDGRIDYFNSDKAPVLTCFVKYENRILLLKRSDLDWEHTNYKWIDSANLKSFDIVPDLNKTLAKVL